MLDCNTNVEPCYFTIVPPTTNTQLYYNIDHFSTETPGRSSPTFSIDEPSSPHPENPLLALRDMPIASSQLPSYYRASNSIMQVQTSAAYGHSTGRPRPNPVQNVLHVTSDDSTSASDSSSSSSEDLYGMSSTPDFARCSRCQRTASLDVKTGKSNMVQYGLNLWYCSRCASMVGLTNR